MCIYSSLNLVSSKSRRSFSAYLCSYRFFALSLLLIDWFEASFTGLYLSFGLEKCSVPPSWRLVVLVGKESLGRRGRREGGLCSLSLVKPKQTHE